MLRERGQHEEAERLRAGELMTTLAAVRSPADTDAAVTERLNSIFAVEAERAANAAVLAEILLPMISDQLRLAGADAQPRLPINGTPGVAAATAPALKPATPRPASIADFIDEMIAQEKPPERSGPGTQRRAS